MKQWKWLSASILALAPSIGCGSDTDNPASTTPAPPPPCDRSIAGNICTIAGNGENGYDGDDGPALEALFSLPQDTLTSTDGTVYILDWNNHRIRKLDADGVIRHVAGRGELGGTLDDPANGDFNHPTGMLFTPGEGQMIIAAWHNSKVRTLDLGTGAITDTCGDGRRAYWGDGGPAVSASLDLPASVAWDPQGNLVILDQANQVFRFVDPAGNIHPLYGRCVIDAPAPSGPGACADGVEPTVCPAVGGSSSGKSTCGDPATTCTNPCTPAFNGDDIPAVDMRMGQPFGQSADPGGRMLFDPLGRLYFADAGNSIIRRIDPDGIVRRVAGIEPVEGAPQRGYSGDGGPATEALLNNPVDLALGEDGTLYFTDVYNHCVRSIDPAGIIETVAGVCGRPGSSGDGGPATDALLKRPYGVEVIPGALLITDTGNNTIRSVKF
jgi:hypothetical protein